MLFLFSSVFSVSILPDFVCELHSCFDDQRSVWMHGHTRLSFNHKSTKRKSGSHFRKDFRQDYNMVRISGQRFNLQNEDHDMLITVLDY